MPIQRHFVRGTESRPFQSSCEPQTLHICIMNLAVFLLIRIGIFSNSHRFNSAHWLLLGLEFMKVMMSFAAICVGSVKSKFLILLLVVVKSGGDSQKCSKIFEDQDYTWTRDGPEGERCKDIAVGELSIHKRRLYMFLFLDHKRAKSDCR